MSEAEGNYEVFKDCLSSAVLDKYAVRLRKVAKRPRKSLKAPPSSNRRGPQTEEEFDPAELADFIEVLPKSLPKRIFQRSGI